MPGKRTARVRVPRPVPIHEQKEAEPAAKQPRLEPVEEQAVKPGRPHQALVESEARKYWEEMVQPGSLAKPDRQELRTAAMPILIEGLRRRGGVRFLPPTVKAHMAVNAMHMRAEERDETTRPYNGPYPSPDYKEALIQYADDTRLLPREIPLPEHREPKHPPIYYYIDPITKQPTPREDSYIRGDYVYDNGVRVTSDDRIFPLVIPANGMEPNPLILLARGWNSCFTLEPDLESISVKIYWLEWIGNTTTVCDRLLTCLYFSPHP